MLKKPSVFYLSTGFFNTQLTDGGTRSILTLLEKLHHDGFDIRFLNLTQKNSFSQKDLARKIKQKEARISSSDNNEMTVYLKGYSFPFTFYFCNVDIIDAYRNHRRKAFDLLTGAWREILATKRCDVAITSEVDVFSMTAALNSAQVRLHRLSSPAVFNKKQMPYLAYFIRIMPQFRFVCAGKFLQRKLREDYGQASINLPPQINSHRFRPHNRRREFISTVCRSLSHKGFILFINIAKNMPKRKFLLIAKAEAAVLLKENNIHNVKIVWPVKDMSNVYDKTRVLLVPSLWEEPFGRVITEAMACGIPVIANDVGGIREALNSAGFLVKISEDLRGKIDFQTAIRYHIGALSSYLKHLRYLDDPRHYQEAAQKSLSAAAKVQRKAEKAYQGLRKKLVSYIKIKRR
ncbi:MAG: glycosyltransferase family 4 protein [Candidatus Saganbacteria bacterium]|nr:glycosyltransferase family 4 protein [Candidatus Saganbacteria bacterium]